MIVSFNFYYARPSLADRVLRQRLRACDVRQDIGVPRGRVLARTAGAADLPDVIWEHQFDDVAGHHADMAVRAASPQRSRNGARSFPKNAIRPIAIGKKNGLFAGSERAGKRAAAIQSLFATAKRNHLDPQAWLKDVLEKLPTWPNRRIDELLPFNGYRFG